MKTEDGKNIIKTFVFLASLSREIQKKLPILKIEIKLKFRCINNNLGAIKFKDLIFTIQTVFLLKRITKN
jgi:hypothetical protein